MTNRDIELEIETKVFLLENLIDFQIKQYQTEVFISALMTDAAYEEFKSHKLNEVYHLKNHRGLETVGDAVLGLIVCDKFADLGFSRAMITEERKKLLVMNHYNTIVTF